MGKQMTIELDQFLYGEATEEEIRDFWENGEFNGEQYLVAAIKKYLRDDEDKQIMFDLDLSIEDMMNGRYTGDQSDAVHAMYAKWNEKVGHHHFGS